MPRTLTSASRNYALSALIAARAVREARKVRNRGLAAVAAIVIAHQIANAKTSDVAIAEMLAEQGIKADPEAVLDYLQFSTPAANLERMLAQIPASPVRPPPAPAVQPEVKALPQVDVDWQFDRLIESIVQDAGRAAESVAVATRRRVGWIRHLTLPSCDRCAVLAGRVYRYSDGFLRHPGCDCTMTPVYEGDETYAEDPVALMKEGLITGLSKADQRAILDGADFTQVVNAKRAKAGLLDAGNALTRAGRPTPYGIYRIASTQDEAIALLRRYRYIK